MLFKPCVILDDRWITYQYMVIKLQKIQNWLNDGDDCSGKRSWKINICRKAELHRFNASAYLLSLSWMFSERVKRLLKLKKWCIKRNEEFLNCIIKYYYLWKQLKAWGNVCTGSVSIMFSFQILFQVFFPLQASESISHFLILWSLIVKYWFAGPSVIK